MKDKQHSVKGNRVPDKTADSFVQMKKRSFRLMWLIVGIQLLSTVSIGLFIGRYFDGIISYLADILHPYLLNLIGIIFIFAVGGILYDMRERNRLLYGIVEVVFALVYGWFAFNKMGGQKGYIESISVIAAIYLVVRGLDNFQIGRLERLEKS